MYNEKYYQEKLIALNNRLVQNKTNTLNDILSSLQRYLRDEKDIISDSNEIQKRMGENKGELVDKEGKEIKVEEPTKEKKE